MLWDISATKSLKNVNDYIRSHFVYVEEQIETLQTPEYMLKGLEQNHYLTGDCDDISTFHAALLTCMGVDVKFVAIKSTDKVNYDHVFVQAKNTQTHQWETFDMTVPEGTALEYFGKVEVSI